MVDFRFLAAACVIDAGSLEAMPIKTLFPIAVMSATLVLSTAISPYRASRLVWFILPVAAPLRSSQWRRTCVNVTIPMPKVRGAHLISKALAGDSPEVSMQKISCAVFSICRNRPTAFLTHFVLGRMWLDRIAGARRWKVFSTLFLVQCLFCPRNCRFPSRSWPLLVDLANTMLTDKTVPTS